MHYRQIWEKANNKKIPDGYEIHHIDGNRENNDLTNLKLVSILEHLEIHKEQQDWGAVQAILIRLENYDKNEVSMAASKTQKKLIADGNHNFQKIDRSKNSKELMKKRLESGNPAFLNIENTIENSRKAGLIAAKKKAGFLNTNSPNHGSKKVKSTFWWINDKGERIRSKECPGENWIKGMKIHKQEEKNES